METTVAMKMPKMEVNNYFKDVFFDYSHGTEIYYGGASSGKSHGVIQKVVMKALTKANPPRRMLFARKVGRSVRQSIFEDVKCCLQSLDLWDACKVNQSNMIITLPNRSEFLFTGVDDIEKLKSIKRISDVIMEEATEFNQEDYLQLQTRLREPIYEDRQIFMMFNPVSKANWVYKYFFKNGHDNDVLITHSTYKDNRFIDGEVKQNLEKLIKRDPAFYKIYALGEFATLDKLVFPYKTIKRLNYDEMRKFPNYFGLDFGYTHDPTAFLRVAVDMKNEKLYIVEEYVKTGMTNKMIANAIRDAGYSKERIHADSAEPKSIAELRKEGITRVMSVKKAPDSVVQGITFMKEFEIIIDDRCSHTIEEFENYTWIKDKKTGEYINKPIDKFNHCIDAVRYALEEINGKGKGTVKSFK